MKRREFTDKFKNADGDDEEEDDEDEDDNVKKIDRMNDEIEDLYRS